LVCPRLFTCLVASKYKSNNNTNTMQINKPRNIGHVKKVC
jgi:hypothetical protein